jgi:hypothetical protein
MDSLYPEYPLLYLVVRGVDDRLWPSLHLDEIIAVPVPCPYAAGRDNIHGN